MGTTTTGESHALKPTAITMTQSAPMSGIAPSHANSYTPPDEPLVVIEADKSWGALDLRELWAHRELLFFLVWRDIKVRYKQTLLGVAWVVMQPLLMTVIFTVFLGMLTRVPTDGVPYPLLAFTGLLPWTFFATAVAGCGQSLVASSNLITKVYFPRVLVPAANVGARLVDFAISFVILAGLMLYYRVAPTPQLVLLPLVVALVTLLALGLGMLAAALNVKYRDVGVAIPVALQLWMFASPVIYPIGLVPGKWRMLFALNPMVGIIDSFRASVLGGHFDRFALAVSVVTAVVLFIGSSYFFRRVEKGFADVI